MAKKSKSHSVTKLQQQLHGKTHSTPSTSRPIVNTAQITPTGFKLPVDLPTPNFNSTTLTDTRYLRHDLTKILVLSTSAIAIQLLLYFALRHGLTIRGF